MADMISTMHMPDRRGSPAGVIDRSATAALSAPILLAVFMFSLVLPVSFDVAGFRLTPARIVLLIMFIPLSAQLLAGRAGRVSLVDLLMVLFSIWLIITFLYHDGVRKLAYSSVTVVELLGGYLLARVAVRSMADFRFLFRLHLILLLVLAPFAVIDFLTNNQIWAKMLDVIGDAKFRGGSSRPRWGLQRVATGFEHPILYGIFCSIGVANGLYLMRSRLMGLIRGGFTVFMTFMSLSAGALLAAMLQFVMIGWDWISGAKWKLFVALSAAAWIFLELASNRGPVVIIIETMTFNSGTGWTRIIQWEYGSAEVLRNPIFGKGLTGDWIRPSWLYTSSIDNYWLVVAFRHGLPGIALLLGAFALTCWRIIRTRNLAPEIDQARTGYMIAMAALFFSLVTVHIWGGLSIFVYAYLGAGAWFIHAGGTETASAAPETPEETGTRYSRFSPTRHHRRPQGQ